MSTDRLRAPSTALDLQLDLLDRYDDRVMDHIRRLREVGSDEAGVIKALDLETSNAPIRRDIDTRRLGSDGAEDGRTGLGGRTIWVGPEIVPMIEHAAATIPAPESGMLSLAGVLQDPAGTVWFAGDPVMLTASTGSDDVQPVIGVSWSLRLRRWWEDPTTGLAEPSPFDGAVEILSPTMVCWTWLAGDPWPILGHPTLLAVHRDVLAMIGVDTTVEGFRDTLIEWSEDWPTPVMEVPRLMLATWIMCGQILPRHIETAGRAQRRRASRMLMTRPLDWGEVHVSTLRHAARDEDGEGGGEDVGWSHQWVVRGHWRWQRCGAGGKDRRLTWIAPHVKGPEGAPLIEVEQVAKLVR